MAIAKNRDAFKLEIPLDASGLGDLKDEERQDLKVIAVAKNGETVSTNVKLDKAGKGKASVAFESHPGAVRTYVGPATATDEELLNTATLNVNIGAYDLAERKTFELEPVLISPYFWWWWLRWCREFVIRGRVVCPDGQPVPGAKVCASDVDWWFLWSSSQEVACTTTDINGAFEMKFRWCCGYYPWWWWQNRSWQFDNVLADRVQLSIGADVASRLGTIASQPNIETFRNLIQDDGLDIADLRTANAGQLESLRERLVAKLPASPDLSRLHVWPWHPWRPWWDCTPDIIFNVTQECDGVTTTIVNETVSDTRWNISNPLDVVLVAEGACCVPPGCEDQDCDGDCIVVDTVCGIPLDQIGGNLGAAPAPAGYYRPGAVAPGSVAWNGDRPFAGTVTVTKNPGDLVGVDFYEIEYFNGAWGPLPASAELSFNRQYWEPAGTPQHVYPAFPAVSMSGHNVYETREHRQAALGGAWLPAAGWTRAWLSYNFSTLAVLNSATFADGTHRFRVVGWDDAGGGNINNPKVIEVCGTTDDNEFVLTFDNRTVTAIGHDPTHNCGTVHTCTVEPDTHILDVRINGVSIDPCDVAEAQGPLEIDFEVTDPDGHLAEYDLHATFGLNEDQPLLGLGTITQLSGDPIGPTYGQALGPAADQGAVAPYWYGGRYRLTIADASVAFPKPCCYQLELTAWKRTVVSCSGGRHHWNQTEYSLGIGIC